MTKHRGINMEAALAKSKSRSRWQVVVVCCSFNGTRHHGPCVSSKGQLQSHCTHKKSNRWGPEPQRVWSELQHTPYSFSSLQVLTIVQHHRQEQSFCRQAISVYFYSLRLWFIYLFIFKYLCVPCHSSTLSWGELFWRYAKIVFRDNKVSFAQSHEGDADQQR